MTVEGASLRFADQQMNVLGHDHIADHYEAIALAYFFQNAEKQIAAAARGQPRLAMVAAASEEVQVPVAVSSGADLWAWVHCKRKP
jgi:hypothetical protein